MEPAVLLVVMAAKVCHSPLPELKSIMQAVAVVVVTARNALEMDFTEVVAERDRLAITVTAHIPMK
jgi:hypothetical protein